MSRAGEPPNSTRPASAQDRGPGGERATGADIGKQELAGGICHRVKNDLQTLANLLALAAPHAASPMEMAEALEGRVGAMSVSYTLVAETGAPPTLDRLAGEIARRSQWRLSAPLSLENNLPALELSLRLCSPLSIWLHEVVVNALVHGLANSRQPRLILSGGLNGDVFQVSVMDNGPGLPPGFDATGNARFGLKVAQAVARSDLRGQMELKNRQEGLEARLELPAHEFESLKRVLWS
jgi:two-component sensor histidine kinase